jgi:hypothetical protein
MFKKKRDALLVWVSDHEPRTACDVWDDVMDWLPVLARVDLDELGVDELRDDEPFDAELEVFDPVKAWLLLLEWRGKELEELDNGRLPDDEVFDDEDPDLELRDTPVLEFEDGPSVGMPTGPDVELLENLVLEFENGPPVEFEIDVELLRESEDEFWKRVDVLNVEAPLIEDERAFWPLLLVALIFDAELTGSKAVFPSSTKADPCRRIVSGPIVYVLPGETVTGLFEGTETMKPAVLEAFNMTRLLSIVKVSSGIGYWGFRGWRESSRFLPGTGRTWIDPSGMGRWAVTPSMFGEIILAPSPNKAYESAFVLAPFALSYRTS